MKIATVATGGIGGFLAVKLGLRGHKVATIARGAHLDAISTDDPKNVGEVDAVIFGVKGDDLETAAKACLPLVGRQTVVVPFLNGVEASDRLTKIIPQQNVANGMAQVSTTISAPGVITQTGDFNQFVFAERDNQPSERIAALQRALTSVKSSRRASPRA